MQPAYTAQAPRQTLIGPAANRQNLRVALVCMPCLSIARPSLSIGLLKAIACDAGFSATTFHLNLDFAARIGLPLYEAIAQYCGRGRYWGDWLFSWAAFGERAPDPDARLLTASTSDIKGLQAAYDKTGQTEPADVRERLKSIRRVDVPAFLDTVCESTPWHEFRVIGFSSTYQQNVASFALAARIKQRCPGVVIVFGGANFEGEMGIELTRSIPAIDYTFIGEADEAFPEFLNALSEGRDPAQVPGVVFRQGDGVSSLRRRPLIQALDLLPTPDYSEYFERAARLGLIAPASPGITIPFESSRGCWWGEKRQCSFCGLNGVAMKYRAKSSQRVLDELSELARRHQCFSFAAVDNILDHSYFRSLLPALAAGQYDFSLFYEVKANLAREQIKSLSLGGVRRIQAGIESLNSHVLALMDKGTSAAQNVNLLRWARYYGVRVGWNLLWGFPGETEADCAEQLALIRLISHLEPPSDCGRIWMERFSPLFLNRSRFPATRIQPERGYRYVYPADMDLSKIAFFFEYNLENTLAKEAYTATISEVDKWSTLWKAPAPPGLTFSSAPGLAVIDDKRDPDRACVCSYASPWAEVYGACSDKPHSARNLKARLGIGAGEEEVRGMLEEFRARGLMMRDGEVYLSLAIPRLRGR